MRPALCALVAAGLAFGEAGGDWDAVESAVKVVQQVKKAPPSAPEEKKAAERVIEENLGKIDRVADKHKDDARAQVRVTEAFLAADEPKRALPRAERAVELAPRQPQVYVSRGRARYAAGDFAGAYADAKTALKLDPKDARAFTLLKLAEGRSGGSASPSKASEPAKASPPAPQPRETASSVPPELEAAAARARAVELALQSRSLLKLGDFPRALEAADRAAELAPSLGAAQAARAFALAASGRAAEALEAAEKAVAASPRDGAALLARARAFEGLRRPPAEVLSAYKAAAEASPALAAEYEAALARLSGTPGDPAQRPAPGMSAAGGRPSLWWSYWKDVEHRPVGWLLAAGAAIGGVYFWAYLRRRRSGLDD